MIFIQKAKLRKSMSILRGKILGNDRDIAENAMLNNFLRNFPNFLNQVISGYKAIKDEPNLDQLYLKLVQTNNICFPNIINKNLIFKDWKVGMKFIFNKRYQTYELDANNIEKFPDILLVPLLAADLSGNRLGYGGGFYDRYIYTITKIKKVITIGICFDFQIIKELPVEKHDQKLNFILTDKRLINTKISQISK